MFVYRGFVGVRKCHIVFRFRDVVYQRIQEALHGWCIRMEDGEQQGLVRFLFSMAGMLLEEVVV